MSTDEKEPTENIDYFSAQSTEDKLYIGKIAAGLPESSQGVENQLRKAGIDPDRLSILRLGWYSSAFGKFPTWLRRMLAGMSLWLLLFSLEAAGIELNPWLSVSLSLAVGLTIIQASCQALVSATEQFAARVHWDHYVAGSVAEILSTIPELVVVAFVVPVSPYAAFVIAMVTIYNNALVFSLYSYFLPKNKSGKFVMPEPITDAGTQVLVAGGALGLVLGLTMLTLRSNGHPDSTFSSAGIASVSVMMLVIFFVYIFKLVRNYAKEEEQVIAVLKLNDSEQDVRQNLVYEKVVENGFPIILMTFVLGIAGAFIGGERVAEFAQVSLSSLGVSEIVTALILAGFAGMSEYVILWNSHRKGEYGIALANAFGGITQVLFLLVPVTLLAIVVYGQFNPAQNFEFGFSTPTTLLVLFLFPTFYTLSSLLEEDHTFDILDTTIMTAIVALLLALLIGYGNHEMQVQSALG